jgi:alkylhydroperoxidase family enzyme
VIRDSFVRDGSVTPFFRVLAHHPRLLSRVGGLSGFVFMGGELPIRDREIVVLRTLARSRCAREFAEHAAYAEANGLSADEIDILARQPVVPGSWTEDDRALVEMADQVLAEADIDDDIFQRLVQKFLYSGVLELIVAVSTYRMIASIINAARMPAEEGARHWEGLIGPGRGG